MVDFRELLDRDRRIKAEEVFVGYCRICDILSRIYESNIARLADNPDYDLFKCPRCNAFSERHQLIPF